MAKKKETAKEVAEVTKEEVVEVVVDNKNGKDPYLARLEKAHKQRKEDRNKN